VDIPVDDYSSRLKEGIHGWRVAVASGDYIDVTDSEIMSTIETAVNVLKDMGAILEKVDVSWLEKMAAANTQMTQADGAAFHRERLMMHPESFGEDVHQRLLNGAALTASEYSLARHVQVESCRYFDMLFEKYDLLILPTTPIPAPLIEGTQAIEAARQLTRFTSPFNLVGVPALSVPCGFTASGLPIGIQFVTKRWGESKVLQAGYAYQQVTDWHKKHPNI
jgi:aspartyl-tRNA(Asn)/glutamyl-tRNA(Gln) amidotransferase subunit A